LQNWFLGPIGVGILQRSSRYKIANITLEQCASQCAKLKGLCSVSDDGGGGDGGRCIGGSTDNRMMLVARSEGQQSHLRV
jgi:hypothetical protein